MLVSSLVIKVLVHKRMRSRILPATDCAFLHLQLGQTQATRREYPPKLILESLLNLHFSKQRCYQGLASPGIRITDQGQLRNIVSNNKIFC